MFLLLIQAIRKILKDFKNQMPLGVLAELLRIPEVKQVRKGWRESQKAFRT